MKAISISIPKPCHEDWKKMTPDEKGAFCGSCQKSVYDFSKKTNEEIIDVFEEKGKEKVCGRFAPSQLSSPIISFGNETSTTRLTKFICALLLVFGASLFSGVATYSQNSVKGEVQVRMGKVAATRIDPTSELTNEGDLKTKPSNCLKKTKGQAELMPLGDVMVVEEVVEELVFGQSIAKEVPEIKIQGDTIISENINLIEPEETVPINVLEREILELPDLSSECKCSMEEEVVAVIVTEIIQEEEVIEQSAEEQPANALETKIFPSSLEIYSSPNPSIGQIKLSYQLKTKAPVKINLFDITGQLIRTLENGSQHSGRYNVSYDISNLPNGIYIATLEAGNQKSSTKIILTR